MVPVWTWVSRDLFGCKVITGNSSDTGDHARRAEIRRWEAFCREQAFKSLLIEASLLPICFWFSAWLPGGSELLTPTHSCPLGSRAHQCERGVGPSQAGCAALPCPFTQAKAGMVQKSETASHSPLLKWLQHQCLPLNSLSQVPPSVRH